MDGGTGRWTLGLRKIARTALRVDQAAADISGGVGVVSGAMFLLFVAIFVPVGLVAFFALLMLFFAISLVLPDTLAGGFVVVGIGASLVGVFAVFVKLYRRLPRRLREVAADPTMLVPADAGQVAATPAAIPPTPQSPAPSLAELDARLAPPRPGP